MPKLLFLLQNAWQYDAVPGQHTWLRPDDYRELVGKIGAERAALVDHRAWRRALDNSQTGRRLREFVPEGLVIERDYWIGEASPLVGDHSGSYFPPNLAHIEILLLTHQPRVVVSLGRHAKELAPLFPPRGILHIAGRHPAWRFLTKAATAETKRAIEEALRGT